MPVLLVTAFGMLSIQDSANAQPVYVDAVMRPASGEVTGELAKGELLVAALKREKIETNSARLAIQSIGKIFDFRLSRTGDRYVYRVANGRKLTMLRYQRGLHVYEAVLNPETGEFKARIIEVEASPEIPLPMPGSDEDGEVDVEHAVMAEQIEKNQPSQNEAPPTGSIFDAPQPMPTPTPLPQPEDDALAGKPSPDADYPDSPESDLTIPEAKQNPDELPDEIEDEEDERLHAPVIQQEAQHQEPENTIIPTAPALRDTQFTPPQSVKKVEVESTVFSTISITMFVLGMAALLITLFVLILPGIQAKRRCSANGMRVRNMIRISPSQRIACVEQNGHACIISIERNTMSFIAPCPVDDAEFWKKLNAKTYWHQMAQKPLSDRQLASLIQQMTSTPKSALPTHPQQEAPADDSNDDSTAVLAVDIENALLRQFDDEDLNEEDAENAQ